MKLNQILFTALALLVICPLKAQTVDKKIEDVLTGIYQDDGILLSSEERTCTADCIWDKSKPIFTTSDSRKKKFLKKDEYLKNLLVKKFKTKLLSDQNTLNDQYVFNISLCKMGSCVIHGSDFSPLKNPAFNPQLHLLQDGKEIILTESLSPQSTNFVINYNSEQSFKITTDAEVNAQYLSYFKTKQDLVFKKDQSSKRFLNLGVGVFSNKLANLFVKANTSGCNIDEFPPLYDLWTLYSTNQISSRDSIVRSFQGIVYYSHMGSDQSENMNLAGSVEAGGNAQFIDAKTKTTYSFANSRDIHISGNAYSIYMFSKPEMASLPTPEVILSNWTTLNKISKFENTDLQKIPSSSPILVKVVMGPIPNSEAIKDILIDENYTKSKMKSKFIDHIEIVSNDDVNGPKYDPSSHTAIISLKIYADQNYIESTPILQDFFSENIDIRLYYNFQNNGKYLDYIFKNLPISADRMPLITVTNDPNKETFTSTKNGNFYEYTIRGEFTSKPGQKIVKSPAPIVSAINNIPSDLGVTEKELLETAIKNGVFNIYSENHFNFTFKIPITTNIFNANVTQLNRLEVVAKINDGYKNYSRSFQISINGPEEKINLDPNITSQISFESIPLLVSVLDVKSITGKDSILISNSSYKTNSEEMMEAVKGEDQFNFVERLKLLNKDFTVDSKNGKYFIKSTFIDLIKYNKTKK